MAFRHCSLTLALQPSATPESQARVASLGPHLQGVLMGLIDTADAETLHAQSGTNPYSQYATPTPDGLTWHVCTLTDEVSDAILPSLLDESLRDITLRSDDLTFDIVDRRVETVPMSDMTAVFATSDDHRLQVEFVTPTAFRQAGRYVFWPDTRLVLQSLATKYSAITSPGEEPDPQFIDELASHTMVSRYSLRSVTMPIPPTRIPGCLGHLTLALTGPSTLRAYISMLLRFGEFSGVGVKTSMGMGAMRVVPPRSGHDNSAPHPDSNPHSDLLSTPTALTQEDTHVA